MEGSELVRGSMSILQKFVCTVIVKQSKRSSGARPSRCCLITRSYIRLGTGQGQLICARHLQRNSSTLLTASKSAARSCLITAMQLQEQSFHMGGADFAGKGWLVAILLCIACTLTGAHPVTTPNGVSCCLWVSWKRCNFCSLGPDDVQHVQGHAQGAALKPCARHLRSVSQGS